MKKIINDSKTLVADMAKGYGAAYGDIIKIIDNKFVCRTTPKERGKVGVIVANGVGHEPCMISLVGKGLLDVNVMGGIFAAPCGEDVAKGIELADRGAGVIVLVSSHAGDIMNARLGALEAMDKGIDTRIVILWDDIFSAPKEFPDERRGTAGLFFSWKIVSAAAEAGMQLDELERLAETVRDNTRTLTVAIEAGTHPETGEKMFSLPEDEIEVGMGVHGEAGTGRMKITTAKNLVRYMLDNIIQDKPFNAGNRVLVLLNNCGSMTDMEMYIIYGEITEYLREKRIDIADKWIGRYSTTQEMAGFALSLCAVDGDMLRWYKAPAETILKF